MAIVGDGYGAFSALARQQYAAVMAMRWQMLRHGLKTKRGGFEMASRIFNTAFFGSIGLLISIGMGFGAYTLVNEHRYAFLPALVWPVFVLWQMLPLMIASFQEHTDFGAMRRFPLSFGSWVLLSLTDSVLNISTLLGCLCVLGLWFGLVLARPAAAPGVTLALLLFAMFNFLFARMIFVWLDRWLAQRKTREILGACFLFLLLGTQLIGPAIRHFNEAGRARRMHRTQSSKLVEVQAWLPPGVTGLAIESTLRGRSAQWTQSGGLALYVTLAGVLLGVRLRAEYRGENLGESPARATAKDQRKAHTGWGGAGPIGAIVEKELRYLMRSGVMLYGLAAPPFMMLVFGSKSDGPIPGFAPFALPLAAAYSFLGLTRLLSNSFGGDGGGVQLYFLAPVPFRTILLAKNLVQFGLFLFELAVVSVVVFFRFGPPPMQMIVLTACWLLFAIPAQIAAGNLMSLYLAYRMTLTRMSCEQGAAGNGLLSIAIQLAIVGVGAGIYLLLASRGELVLAEVSLISAGALGLGFWFWVAARIDRIAEARREMLIAQLVR